MHFSFYERLEQIKRITKISMLNLFSCYGLFSLRIHDDNQGRKRRRPIYLVAQGIKEREN
jgi:hypothetical protein